MANNMGIVDLQFVKKIKIIEREIDDVIEVLNPLDWTEPRMSRSVHGEMLGQLVQERSPNHRSTRPMQEEERRATPTPLHRGGKFAVPDRHPRLLHATISLNLKLGTLNFSIAPPPSPDAENPKAWDTTGLP